MAPDFLHQNRQRLSIYTMEEVLSASEKLEQSKANISESHHDQIAALKHLLSVNEHIVYSDSIVL
jgi:hypothetical protein